MVVTDTNSRQNRRPDLVTQGTHVRAEPIEPFTSGNLFAKEHARATCIDEAPLFGPQIIRNRSASSRAR